MDSNFHKSHSAASSLFVVLVAELRKQLSAVPNSFRREGCNSCGTADSAPSHEDNITHCIDNNDGIIRRVENDASHHVQLLRNYFWCCVDGLHSNGKDYGAP